MAYHKESLLRRESTGWNKVDEPITVGKDPLLRALHNIHDQPREDIPPGLEPIRERRSARVARRV